MIKHFQEQILEVRTILKEIRQHTLLSFGDFLGQYGVPLSVLIDKPSFSGLLALAVSLKYFNTHFEKYKNIKHELYAPLVIQRQVINKMAGTLFNYIATRLIDSHYFYLRDFAMIHSLPHVAYLPDDLQVITKDDVEIHNHITEEGLEIFVCLPCRAREDQFFKYAENIDTNEHYLINRERIVLPPDIHDPEPVIQQIAELTRHGAAILFYANK